MRKSASDPLAGVEYRSTKKPVNPAKLATRLAVQRLRAVGIEPSQSQRGYPALYGMAKNDPELLDTVLRAIVKSTDNQKKLWKHVLSTFYVAPSAEEAQSSFSYYFKTVPIAAKTFKVHMPPWQALSEVNRVLREFNEVRPDKETDLGSLYEAAILHSSIVPVNRGYTNSRESRRTVSAGNVDDILFIAEHFEAVQRIVPELKKRKIRDRGMIAVLLDNKAQALLEGNL